MEFTCILKAIFSSNIWKCIDRKNKKTQKTMVVLSVFPVTFLNLIKVNYISLKSTLFSCLLRHEGCWKISTD